MDVFSCLCTHLTILIGCRISWMSPCWVMEILVFLFLEHCYNMQLKPKRRKLFEVISFYDLLGRSATRSALVQFSSVTQSWPTLWDPMNDSMPGLPVHHQLPEFTQTHVHWVSNAIQPSHPLSSPSPPAPNPSQHQSLFQWVNSSHEVAKVLEFQR